MSMLKHFYLPLLLLFVIWVSYAITTRSINSSTTDGYLQIEVVPQSASINLDGHNAHAGKLAIASGNHTVTVSKLGFDSVTRHIATEPAQTAYIGIALQPNVPGTQNWYTNNPNDERLAEGIGSHEADYENRTANHNNPFLNQLPLAYGDGQGGIVTVSQGVAINPGGPPAVYVTAATPSIRQGVLTYMRSRGYDPAYMDVVFYGQSNPLDTSGD